MSRSPGPPKGTKKRRIIRTRSTIAASLADPRFRIQTVKSKARYSRRPKHVHSPRSGHLLH